MSERQTFFHIGYARAASTFLQKSVFPALTGLQYIPRNRFRVREKEKKRFRDNKILMSREAGKHIYTRVDRVKKTFGSRIIISLRRHDKLAGSNYRLHAKKGHTIRFHQFVDLDNDQGLWRQDQFNYMKLINYVTETTGEKPIVLIFEDYIRAPDYYMAYLCKALDCEYQAEMLDHKPVHGSYSDKQLRLRRQVADYFSGDTDLFRDKTPQGDSIINFIRYRSMLLASYLFMKFANWAPDAWLTDEPLIPQAQLDRLRDFYADDWAACKEYVKDQNEQLGIFEPH